MAPFGCLRCGLAESITIYIETGLSNLMANVTGQMFLYILHWDIQNGLYVCIPTYQDSRHFTKFTNNEGALTSTMLKPLNELSCFLYFVVFYLYTSIPTYWYVYCICVNI